MSLAVCVLTVVLVTLGLLLVNKVSRLGSELATLAVECRFGPQCVAEWCPAAGGPGYRRVRRTGHLGLHSSTVEGVAS